MYSHWQKHKPINHDHPAHETASSFPPSLDRRFAPKQPSFMDAHPVNQPTTHTKIISLINGYLTFMMLKLGCYMLKLGYNMISMIMLKLGCHFH